MTIVFVGVFPELHNQNDECIVYTDTMHYYYYREC